MKLNIRNIFALLFSMILFSCADKVHDKEEYVDEAQIETFGFYVEDNPELVKDIVVNVVSGSNEIRIPLSRSIDKTALIARYKIVNSNAEVKIGTAKQENGVTVNDFSTPLDYFVSIGNFIRRYTVTLTIAADIMLEKLEPFTREEITSYLMKINPVSGTPYVMFKKKTDSRGAVMIKYENEEWSYIGSSSGFSDGAVGDFDFNFDSKGQPYAVFQDQAEMTVNNALTVMFYDQILHEWKLCGEKGSEGKGITSAKVDFPNITLTHDDQPIIIGRFDGRQGPLTRREAVVSYYSNGSWKTDEAIQGRSSNQTVQYTRSKLFDGVNYFALLSQKPEQTYAIYSYENGLWKIIADDFMEEGATHIFLNGFYMDIDVAGNIYILASDDALVNGSYKARLKKYDKESQEWTQIGTPFDIEVGDDLAVTSDEIPLIVYRNLQNQPTLTMYDSFTGHWTDEIRLDNTTTKDVHIDYDPASKKGYIGFSNALGNFVLYEFVK